MMVPTSPSTLGARSKSITVALHGDPSDTTDLSEAQRSTRTVSMKLSMHDGFDAAAATTLEAAAAPLIAVIEGDTCRNTDGERMATFLRLHREMPGGRSAPVPGDKGPLSARWVLEAAETRPLPAQRWAFVP